MSTKHDNTQQQELRRLVPAVDIYENDEGYLLRVEVPGATRETVRVELEENELVIEARAPLGGPGKLVYGEFIPTLWSRRFQVGNDIERQAIAARVENGLLWVTLPKGRDAKPRKIEIKD